MCCEPSWILPLPRGTSLKNATFGLPGGLDSANPIISAITTGYTISSPTSSGERRRICRSLTNSQRTAVLVSARVRAGSCTNAASRSRGSPPTARSNCAGVPVNSSSPSTSTSTGPRSVRPRRRRGSRRRPPCRPGQRVDELPQADPLARIERRRGLVEQQHGGLAQQPDRDVDPLPVALREPGDLVVGAVLEPRLREHPLDGGLRVGELLEPGEQPQVLGHRQLRVERRLLRHPPERPAAGLITSPSLGASTPRGSTAASSCRRRSGR